MTDIKTLRARLRNAEFDVEHARDREDLARFRCDQAIDLLRTVVNGALQGDHLEKVLMLCDAIASMEDSAARFRELYVKRTELDALTSRIDALEQLIAEAAPCAWAGQSDLRDHAEQWEKKAAHVVRQRLERRDTLESEALCRVAQRLEEDAEHPNNAEHESSALLAHASRLRSEARRA